MQDTELTHITHTHVPHQNAEDIVAGLPPADYTRNYQPSYPDRAELVEAVHELQETEAVTTPRQIDALRQELTALATGEIDRPIIITGRCAEEIDVTVPIESLVAGAVDSLRLVARAMMREMTRAPIVIQRNRGQFIKPRSAATEAGPDGQEVVSYMGDGINGKDITDRTPDPSRLVAGAVQSRDLEAGLTAEAGVHVPAAHEALSLPYEQSFVREDPETGKMYLISTDLPWIGKRTNEVPAEGEAPNAHLELLSKVENPVGVKIGPDSTPEHIAQLQAKLNPSGLPGKLVFMLRMGLHQTEQLATVAAAISRHAPDAIIMYDIHGVTRTAPTGQKIRYTGDIVANIRQTAAACNKAGLKLHGLHLETTPDDSRLECVDAPDQLPTHPGGVDPQLNPRQLAYVLDETKDCLL
jgi:3-deoxy-7-phosphoheptulonate synthase